MPIDGGKSIFLFSDGTGNSSAKLFKTNVWRLYEAIDLGLASPGKRVQVAYYDNGVGTSAFRPLALLGGILGIGLKSNVLRLYSFLCQNYQPGDRIYAFGFSRGAFTIRLLVGLIASQGVIKTGPKAKQEAAPTDGKDDGRPLLDEPLAYQVRDAYRAFCGEHLPNRWPSRLIARGFRALRNRLVLARRKMRGQNVYARTQRHHPNIEFVGVWDTVSAYGGPFAEFTRGIDDWVWPLSMPHYGLSPRVLKARHALALDDERDAFHPLLWDEVREQDMVDHGGLAVARQDDDGRPIREKLEVTPGRLRQVWFPGVHSDVGGGYPDESLSYISLLWMMDELSPDPDAPTVDFIDSFVQRARDLANPYGPLHDSRAGLGAYYRYQPRKIAALLDPPHHRTRSLRDPLVSYGFGEELAARGASTQSLWAKLAHWLRSSARRRPLREEHGLLRKVEVHESAIARIISGIDDYAPAALPSGFDITSSAKPVPGDPDAPAPSFSMPLLTTDNQEQLAAARAFEATRAHLQEEAWSIVWQRRMTYFATVGATIALLSLPFQTLLDPVEKLCSDDRCFAKSLVSAPIFYLPQSIRDFVSSYAEKPLLLIALGVGIWILIVRGKSLERRFRGTVRGIWKDYLARSLATTPGAPSFWRRVRESFTYQDTLYLGKWHVLPFVFGLLTLAAIMLLLVALLSQILYAYAEPREHFCANRSDQTQPQSGAMSFEPNYACADLQVNVEHNRLYVIDMLVDRPWLDDTLPADPERGVVDAPWQLNLFAPLKRVTSAEWFEPLVEVRTHEVSEQRRRWIPIIGHQIDIRRQPMFRTPVHNLYHGLLCPRRSGHLYMMVNDAAPLLSYQAYANNSGSAQIRLTPVAGTIGQCDPERIAALSRDQKRSLLLKLAAARPAPPRQAR